MYQPAAFRETRLEVLHDFIQAHPFASVIIHGDDGLVADHLPLRLSSACLQGHVAAANDLAQRDGAAVLVVFHGPHGYVSPGWYPSKHQTGREVPTWNYAVVQAHGRLRVIDDADWKRTFLQGLTAQHEASMPQPWSIDEAPPDYIAALLGAIRGIEITIDRIEGKFKLAQNKTEANRLGVIDGLRERALPLDMALAQMTAQTLSVSSLSSGTSFHEQ